MEPSSVIQSLRDIGLSSNEATVYNYLLENGALSASLLSKRLKITRTLVYKIIDDLTKIGLISKDESFKVTRFTAAHPYELRKIGERERIAADALTQRIETSLAPLIASYNLQAQKPAVHHMEGLAGVSEVLADTLTSSETIYMYVDTDTLEQELLDIDAEYVPKRIKKGIKKKMLMAHTPQAERFAAESQSELTETKLITSNQVPHFYSFMYIYDKKVSFVTYANAQLTSTLMYDESIYTMQRFVFEALWQRA